MTEQNNTEPTLREILETMNASFKKTDEKFEKIDERFDEMLEAMHTFSNKVEQRFVGIERDITTIKSTMVTKEYLDDKLADQRGDLVVLMRKEDTKLKTLTEILGEKNIINEEEEKRIVMLEPFPQVAL